MYAYRWLTMLLTRHCPQCHDPVRNRTAGVVHTLSRLYCCQAHADTYESSLAAARHDFQHQHAAFHPGSTLLPPGEDNPC